MKRSKLKHLKIHANSFMTTRAFLAFGKFENHF
jgi:hypothetical protein